MAPLVPKKIDLEVSPEDIGQRLDIFISRRTKQISRSQIKRLIDEGSVKVNRGEAKPSTILKGREKISLVIPAPEPTEVLSQQIALDILYEDSDILVLNKEAAMVVHPGAGVNHGTLVNAILGHCKDLSGIGGKLRPGIVHRLDKGTSGVLIVAKNDWTHAALSEQFQKRQVKKTYNAFIWGKPRRSQGVIDSPLGRHVKDRKKISSQSSRVREALTSYRVVETWGPISYLELQPKTGRTHQIRVHMTEMGHPVLGDPIYGKGLRKLESVPKNLQDLIRGFSFQLLHASDLTLVHPRKEEMMTFKAPLREEMVGFSKLLQGWRKPIS